MWVRAWYKIHTTTLQLAFYWNTDPQPKGADPGQTLWFQHQFSIIYIRILNDILLEIYDNCININTLIPYISILSILIGQSVDIYLYIAYTYLYIYIEQHFPMLFWFGQSWNRWAKPEARCTWHDIVPRVKVSSWHFLGNYSSTVVNIPICHGYSIWCYINSSSTVVIILLL
jgi:hypothetical protein